MKNNIPVLTDIIVKGNTPKVHDKLKHENKGTILFKKSGITQNEIEAIISKRIDSFKIELIKDLSNTFGTKK